MGHYLISNHALRASEGRGSASSVRVSMAAFGRGASVIYYLTRASAIVHLIL